MAKGKGAAPKGNKGKQGAAGRRRQPTRRVALGKILRIGIIQSGRIVEERLIPAETSVTVGDHPKSMVVISGADLPNKKFELLAAKGSGYTLQFTDKMHGKVARQGEIHTLASLSSKGPAKKKGSWYSLPLSEDNRGKVYVGDYTVLFQFVTPPPQPARQRRSDFRALRWEEIDWLFLAILLVSALLHTATVIWIESQPPPKKFSLDDLPDRFVKLVLEEETPPPPEEEVVEEEGEGEEEAAEEAPAEEAAPEPSDKPEKAPETADERRERMETEVQSQGLLALIGTAGASSSGDAVADLLSDSLNENVGSALANSSGLAVGRRDSDASGLRGGGGGEGAAGIGELGGAGGGSGGSVAKKKTELKASLNTGNADISTSPEDIKSIKKTMKRYNGRVKACYERQLKGNPDLAGKVMVSFEILTDGTVTAAGIEENTTGNKELESCILKVVRRIKFNPPPPDDVEVAGYPYIFAAQ